MNRAKKNFGAISALTSMLLLASGPGCSYIFVDKPPETHRKLPYFECSSGYASPVVDSVVAGLYAVATIAALAGSGASSSDSESQGGPSPAMAALVGAGVVGLFGSSAYYGFNGVGECKEAKSELMGRTVENQIYRHTPPPVPRAAPFPEAGSLSPTQPYPPAAPRPPQPAPPAPAPPAPAPPATPPPPAADVLPADPRPHDPQFASFYSTSSVVRRQARGTESSSVK